MTCQVCGQALNDAGQCWAGLCPAGACAVCPHPLQDHRVTKGPRGCSECSCPAFWDPDLQERSRRDHQAKLAAKGW